MFHCKNLKPLQRVILAALPPYPHPTITLPVPVPPGPPSPRPLLWPSGRPRWPTVRAGAVIGEGSGGLGGVREGLS